MAISYDNLKLNRKIGEKLQLEDKFFDNDMIKFYVQSVLKNIGNNLIK